MKLYYMPTTRAVRPRWLLEEMGIPYELIRVSMALSKSPEYAQLHPQGKVPVLVDEETVLFESAAICAYLADRHPDRGFAPSLTSPARGHYYQWMFYGALTLEAPIEQYMFQVLPGLPEKMLPKAAQTRVSRDEAQAWFERACAPLNDHLGDRAYLVDDRFTAADVVVGGVLLWALKLGMMRAESPAKRYILELMERPGFQAADEDFYAKMDGAPVSE